MSDFDPDAFLRGEDDEPFDPDAFLAAKPAGHPVQRVPVATESSPTWATEQEAEPEKGLAELATEKTRAALMGATFGLAPKLTGAIASAFPSLDRPVGDFIDGKAPDHAPRSYAQARDAYAAPQEKAAEENPWTAAAGGLLAPIPGLGEIKGAAGLGKMALQGAGAGAITAGASSKALTRGDYGDAAMDVGKGALAGGVVGGGLGAAGMGLKGAYGLAKKAPAAIDDFLRDWAEKRAVKAVAGNGHLKAVKEMNKQGILNKVGRYALDEGVLSPFSTPAKHLERSAALEDKAGATIREFLKEGDAAARPLVSGPDLAAQVRREVIAPLRAGNNADRALAEKFEAEAALLESKGDLGFGAASKYKNSFDKYLKHGAEQSPVQEGFKDIRGLVKRDIENKLDAVGESISPGLGDKYRAAKKSYGLSSELADLAKARAEQLQNNKIFGIGAHQAGGALGLLGAASSAAGGHGAGATGLTGLAMTGAGMAAHKLADSYGPQLFATGLNLGSKVWTNTVVKLAEIAPDSLGKYGGVLAREFQLHGPAGVMAMHHALSKDRRYVADQEKLHADLRGHAAGGGE